MTAQILPIIPVFRICNKCGEKKTLDRFRNRAKPKHHLHFHTCRICEARRHRAIRKISRYENPGRRKYRALRLIWSNSKIRALKRGVPFDIVVANIRELWMSQNGRCAVTGLMMAPLFELRGTGKVEPLSPSFDRVTPNLGYVVGNLRFVCHAVNNFKMQMTDGEMLVMARAVVRGLTIGKRSK